MIETIAHGRIEIPAVVTPAAWDGRAGLPMLMGRSLVVRELRQSDAGSLLGTLSTEEVSRFIARPPDTVEGFERFIGWTHQQRAAARAICFGVVPRGCDAAIGLFQVWPLDSGFTTAEWGFAVGSRFWGTGVFPDSAHLVLDFVFNVIGAHRVEGRAAQANGRGNGALHKLGACREAVLRKCFEIGGEYQNHIMWSILDEDWRGNRDGAQAASQ